MPMSTAGLTTPVSATLVNPTTVQGSDLTAPSPVDVNTIIASKTVSAAAIPSVTVSAPSNVSYTTISTNEEVNNETLNRTAETLKDSINSILGNWATSITSQLGNLQGSVNDSVTGVASNTTAKLGELRTEILDVISDVNAAFEEVRLKEIAQNNSIATTFNTISGQMKANDDALLAALKTVDAKLVAIDDVMQSDAEALVKLNEVKAFIETLRQTDLDFVQAVDAVIDEVNGLRRLFRKEVSVLSATGLYNFNTLNEGIAEFTAAGDYDCNVEVIGNGKAQAYIDNKGAASFDIQVMSKNTHFVDQPIDCSVTPVKIIVTVTHNKLNPTTLNVDTLSNSWLSTGNGTDTNTVGA